VAALPTCRSLGSIGAPLHSLTPALWLSTGGNSRYRGDGHSGRIAHISSIYSTLGVPMDTPTG